MKERATLASGRRRLLATGTAWLLLLGAIGTLLAETPAVVSFPRSYKSSMVKYAVVDRSDGFSRDLYASREAIDALRADPRLKEFSVGALLVWEGMSALVEASRRGISTPFWTREGVSFTQKCYGTTKPIYRC